MMDSGKALDGELESTFSFSATCFPAENILDVILIITQIMHVCYIGACWMSSLLIMRGNVWPRPKECLQSVRTDFPAIEFLSDREKKFVGSSCSHHRKKNDCRIESKWKKKKEVRLEERKIIRRAERKRWRKTAGRESKKSERKEAGRNRKKTKERRVRKKPERVNAAYMRDAPWIL